MTEKPYDWRDYFKPKTQISPQISLYRIESTVTPAAWTLFSLVALSLVCVLLWAFFGYIPVTVTGRGLIVTESGLTSLQAPITGKVKTVLVKPGDKIQKGALLIEMDDPKGNISSPFDGQILETRVSPEGYVKEGVSVIWMEDYSSSEKKENYVIYGFFPIESGKRLKAGAPVEITVPSINPNQYGTLEGTIKNISLFAVSKENLLSEIQNPALVDYLTHQAPAVVKVVVEPKGRPNAFVWSSGIVPEEPITTGTLVTLEATIEKIRPIYYLLPVSGFRSNPEDTNGP